MDFAKKLSAAIRESGMTYQQLAEKSGLSITTIKYYAGGRTKSVAWEKVCALADALGLPSTDYFRDNHKPRSKTPFGS